MREKIDIKEALRLYHTWRNWREVAKRLVRKNGMQFCADAVQSAVRKYDRIETT
jgi:propanediol dehydratase large subunit